MKESKLENKETKPKKHTIVLAIYATIPQTWLLKISTFQVTLSFPKWDIKKILHRILTWGFPPALQILRPQLCISGAAPHRPMRPGLAQLQGP